MPAPSDIRPRVKRLLRGEWRTDDLQRLFVWLRFLTRGRSPAVRDVGDYVAHRDERDQGISWEKGRDFCDMVAWHMHDRTQLNLLTADTLKRAAMAAFRSLGPAAARNKFRMNASKARAVLTSGLAKIARLQNGKAVWSARYTAEEKAVVNYYLSVLAPRLAFNQADLVKQLAFCLVNEGVLDESEFDDFFKCSDYVAAFAVSQMHDSAFLLSDGQLARLQATLIDGEIGVSVVFPIGKVDMITTIVTTELAPAKWLHPSLRTPPFRALDMPLELDSDGRLSPIL